MKKELEKRKTNLINQIKELRKEIDNIKWQPCKAVAFCRHTGVVRYIDLHGLEEAAKN